MEKSKDAVWHYDSKEKKTLATDYRVISSLLMRTGYDPVSSENIEAGKAEEAKLPQLFRPG